MATDLASLEARLQHLEDLEQIRATWLDYCFRLDVGDFTGLADVFREDAVLELDGLAPTLDGTYSGRGPIVDDFYARTAQPFTRSGAPRLMTGHISTNMQIDVQGDEATTLAYFFEIVGQQLLIGTYQHRLRRDHDRWRFAVLRICVRYRARIEATELAGQPLAPIMARSL